MKIPKLTLCIIRESTVYKCFIASEVLDRQRETVRAHSYTLENWYRDDRILRYKDTAWCIRMKTVAHMK